MEVEVAFDSETNERQGQPPQQFLPSLTLPLPLATPTYPYANQVAMLRQLATSCMERAQEEQGPGSNQTSFWAAHSVGRPAPWQAT